MYVTPSSTSTRATINHIGPSPRLYVNLRFETRSPTSQLALPSAIGLHYIIVRPIIHVGRARPEALDIAVSNRALDELAPYLKAYPHPCHPGRDQLLSRGPACGPHRARRRPAGHDPPPAGKGGMVVVVAPVRAPCPSITLEVPDKITRLEARIIVALIRVQHRTSIFC